ncbi:MAG: NADPH-dependent oxidoreductase [Sideroxyarcus sp.]|nr:NADPH-dependent oxidoreductase [Sideroxyarcus sp.]
MNETLRIQQAHRSIRSYTTDPVSDAMLDQIIAAAHRAPTSMNAQDISLIVVRDAEKRARIAELAGGQSWIKQAPVFIVIAIDYHKTDLGVRKAGQAQIIHESMEGFGVAAVDAGIALGTLITAAESLGLGIVPIGSIRRNPQDIIDLLGLPPLTFPLVGLCIGHIKDDVLPKPRMDIKTFRHDERYDASGYPAAIDAYDAAIMDYWKRVGNGSGITWSNNLGNFYKQVYFPQVKPVAAMQGLLNDK